MTTYIIGTQKIIDISHGDNCLQVLQEFADLRMKFYLIMDYVTRVLEQSHHSTFSIVLDI